MNVKETKELVELARSKKLFFMEALWTRFEIYDLDLIAKLITLMIKLLKFNDLTNKRYFNIVYN